ncbi:phosphate acetyltransferase [Propionicimonas sp.]|uniref:phosphate acetyltransferase n=1 Tax=Propionicimonas sp. TaxID=1955623 RepID=UPI00180EB5C7|nr:phosphate acetyltransferase [Propionicimonas sp.]MBU3975885.1 phosphate acetyltransferase [Actinomycetota bacterium]MBA3019716.1 phosphate acetyltransferase [Propionicimonas sp.]MBU4006473.1 phosphate acetyltransferase [Actinomycetota bacterium]MBU4066639.1 phosphate acetyltransferase [Actinomycetota bacterium]MBU4094594.1 phosphate acetyltransferase [Actinomycetota bacterium]
MSTSIYVASPEGLAGKSMVALGMIEALTRTVSSVGVFRPVVRAGVEDEILRTLLAEPGVNQTYEEAVGVTYNDVRADPEAALSNLVEKYAKIREAHEAVVILGSDYTDVASPTELTFNARVAANLNAPVLLVVSGTGRDAAAIRSAAEGGLAEFAANHAKVLAVLANRVEPSILKQVRTELKKLPNLVTGALPTDPLLIAPTVAAQFKAVGATLMQGNAELLSGESVEVLVAGMTLPNVLKRLTAESTVIMPSDRTDLLPGLLLAHASGTFPKLASVILVGGYEIPEAILQLISGIHSDLPIGTTDIGTFTSAERLFRLEGAMTSSPRKVEVARRQFAEHLNADKLLDVLHVHRSEVMTPLMFEHQLQETARTDRKTIVLPESSDDRILTSADIVLRRGAADVILLGDAVDIRARANHLGLALKEVQIIDPTKPDLLNHFAEVYAQLRAHKGVTIEQAKEKLADLSYFGTMMVHLGMADGMVSGAINTTANTIRPSLEFVKTKPGVKVVSSSFLMCMADQVVLYGDCAVNPDPTAEELADIAISTAETAVSFGIEPRVAMLSYSTGTSGTGADVDKVREATEIVRKRRPDLALEGPIQFDAAVDPTVAKSKLPESAVAGRATVFIFPDLNTGNNTYKAVQRSAGAVAIGPVLQGLNKPVNDLSRGALIDDIVNTVAITAIQAQSEKRGEA